jgi:hypothetical protein
VATLGQREAAWYHREGCLLFGQPADQELTKTGRLTAEIAFKYKHNCYQMQSGN